MGLTINHELNLGVVCSHNMNRSMEAHRVLAKKNFNIRSYGTGDKVKLPGATANTPNIYGFDTPYDKIYKDLSRQNYDLYTENGILTLLDRNRRIKKCPERFQDVENYDFDIVFCCEERVFDQAMEHLFHIASEKAMVQDEDTHNLHLINIKITDNHEDAILGSDCIAQLATEFSKVSDLDQEIDRILKNFISKNPNRGVFHTSFFL